MATNGRPGSSGCIYKSVPDPNSCWGLIVGKYADHFPLHRRPDPVRQGVQLDRSTLADWVGRAAWLLGPVHTRLLGRLKASEKLFADERTAPVLDPCRGRTKTGQLWAYARDDRPWGGPEPPGVAYVYAPDRKGERPLGHLNGVKSVLQADGYAGCRPWRRRARCVSPLLEPRSPSHIRTRGCQPRPSRPRRSSASASYAVEAALPTKSERQARSRPLIGPWNPGCAPSSRASAKRVSLRRRSATR